MEKRSFNGSWIFIPFIISIFIFLVSWGIAGISYKIYFDLYSELAIYSELTVPIGLETYYFLLGVQLSSIIALYISLTCFIIGILACWFFNVSN